MKLKQDPEDFRVEELTDVQPGPEGPFAFYRLDKSGWTTPDALAAIRRRWNLHINRIAWGGLKDRHAATSQYITIFRGPRRDFRHLAISLQYLGQTSEPFSAHAIVANRFGIVMRHLTPEQVAGALGAIEFVRDDGVPNYFDDQRFGSVGVDRDFIARRMVRGEFEQALRLALAEPYPYDRAETKREKETLRECWGQWTECKARLPRGHARSLVDFLCHHPDDYRNAVARLRPELQGLFLAAYQSFLWNAILGEWIDASFPGGRLDLDLRLGAAPVPRSMNDEERTFWRKATLPLPAARWKLDPNAVWAPAAVRILAGEGLTWDTLKIRGLSKPFFSKGERPAWCVPGELSATPGDDERNPGRMALHLMFTLPRGSYATLIVKRLMAT